LLKEVYVVESDVAIIETGFKESEMFCSGTAVDEETVVMVRKCEGVSDDSPSRDSPGVVSAGICTGTSMRGVGSSPKGESTS